MRVPIRAFGRFDAARLIALMLKRDSLAPERPRGDGSRICRDGSTVADPVVDNTSIVSSANVLRTIPGQDGVIP